MRSLGEFQYFEPSNLQYAVHLLSQLGEEASVLAGGTDLLVMMKDGRVSPKYLVNIKRIPHLDEITYDEETGLTIGALATINAVHESGVIRRRFGVIAQAAGVLASYQVRNRATLGGNLCNASPAADMAPPLIAYDARARIVGPRGDMEIPLERFFLGPGKTVIEPGMILKEVFVPNPRDGTHGVHLKHGVRRAMECAIVNVAALLVAHNDFCEDARIVLGSVAPTLFRARDAEGEVRGKKLGEVVIARAAEVASRESRPISDVRGSAEYRREMVRVFVKRALKQVWLESRSKDWV